MNKKSLLITDLDNTLFDWFYLWHQSFLAMLEELESTSGINKEILIPEIKKIHEKHGTAEYSFLIQEIPSLIEKHKNSSAKEILKIYDSSIHAYKSQREKSLSLYPTVFETLDTLKKEGVLIVGYTESLAYYTSMRLRKLELDGVLDYIYSPADHDIPKNIDISDVRSHPIDHYELHKTVHRSIPAGEIKPNAKILLKIVEDLGGIPENCVYVGDSLTRDIKMAQDAHIDDVFAEYGVSHTVQEYNLLRQVTHWTDEQVEKEKNTPQLDKSPSYTLKDSFSEILELFEFKRYER